MATELLATAPSAQKCIDLMREVSPTVMDMYGVQTVLTNFANEIAEQKLNPSQVVEAWAAANAHGNLRVVMMIGLNAFYADYIRAIYPDNKAFAKKVIYI